MKTKTIFAGLVFLLAFSLLGCPTPETKIVEKIIEIEVNSAAEYDLEIDTEAAFFVAPMGATVASPKAVVIKVTNRGQKETGALDIKIQGNTWLTGSRDIDDQDGTGSFFTDVTFLPSLEYNKSTIFTVNVREFAGPTVNFPTYIQPAIAKIEIGNANVEKTFTYTVGTYRPENAEDLSIPDLASTLPRIGQVVSIDLPPEDPDFPVPAALYSSNHDVAVVEDGKIRFIAEGSVSIGYMEGHGFTLDSNHEGEEFDPQPFVFYKKDIIVMQARPFWIEKVEVINQTYNMDVTFSEPVKNLDASKFMLLMTDRNLNERQDTGGDGGDIIPVLPYWGGENSIFASASHSNGSIHAKIDPTDVTQIDADGKVWRLSIGDENPDNPHFSGRQFGVFTYGTIGRLLTTAPGAAFHAEDNTPLPKIDAMIVNTRRIGFPGFGYTLSSPQLGTAGLYMRGNTNIPGYYSSNPAPVTIPSDPSEPGYDPDYLDGGEYLLRNVITYINKQAAAGTAHSKAWLVVLDQDQVYDLAKDFPATTAAGTFRWSQLLIAVTTGTPKAGDAAYTPVNAGKVTVKWESTGKLEARNGLSLFITGRGSDKDSSKLVFDAANAPAYDGNATPVVPGLKQWIGAGPGGRLVVDGAVIFENHTYDGNDVNNAAVGLYAFGSEGGASLIVNNAVIRNNTMKSTRADTTVNWNAMPQGGGITALRNAVVIMHGGEIYNNKVDSPMIVPKAGGIAVGAFQVDDSNYYFLNGQFFMTGGKVYGNEVVGVNTTTAAGILAGGVFQKNGGVIEDNKVTGQPGQFNGPQLAVVFKQNVFGNSGPQLNNRPQSNAVFCRNAVAEDKSLFMDWNGYIKVNRWVVNPLVPPAWWVSQWD